MEENDFKRIHILANGIIRIGAAYEAVKAVGGKLYGERIIYKFGSDGRPHPSYKREYIIYSESHLKQDY